MTHHDTSKRILALDLATVTGFALLANGIISSGSQDFTRKPATKSRLAEHQGASYSKFDNWLSERLRDDKPDTIVFEEVFRWCSSSAAHCFGGYRGIMMLQLSRKGIPCFAYSPTTIKKYWTGNGAAKKELMMETTMMRFPDLDLTDSNEADAIAILHTHLKNY